MASSNKVVLVKRGSFGVGHSATKVFDNRKQLTSWLPNNIHLADPDNDKKNDPKTVFQDDAVLRDAVDDSFVSGTPLRYNSNYVVAKWLSGSIDDQTVFVRVALEYDTLTGITFGPFVPSSETLQADKILDIFKLPPKNLPRVRVVSSMEPFCEASKAGFQVGDILLRHRQQRKTELFLESDKKPLLSELETSKTGVLFVARLIPTPTGFSAASSNALASTGTGSTNGARVPAPSNDDGMWSLVRATDIVLGSEDESKEESDDDDEVTEGEIDEEEDDDVLEEIIADAKVPAKKKIPSPKAIHGLRPNAAFARRGWASHTKAPPNHIFATEEKVLSYQIPLGGTRAVATGSSRARKSRIQAHSTKKNRKPVTSVNGENGENDISLANLSLADDKKPASKSSKMKASHAAKRIAELEAEVAHLKKALAEKEPQPKK